MRMRILVAAILLFTFGVIPAKAQNNDVIVRDTLGLTSLQGSCQQVGCTVDYGLDGKLGQVYLVTPTQTTCSGLLGCVLNTTFNLLDFITNLLLQPGVADALPDVTLNVTDSGLVAPSGLYDTTLVNYYGSKAWHGYVAQPAAQDIYLQDVQRAWRYTGTGVVAVIDTGVDPSNTVLKPILLTGYDFTRNQSGGNEMADLTQRAMAVVDGVSPAEVNQRAMAVVDQTTASSLDVTQYQDFGHGTMVSGIVHLVAPTAKIMPLKAFGANGSGKMSDVLRAIYYAVQNHANVINMSFDIPTAYQELDSALNYATKNGVVCVASVGNDGVETLVYPASYTADVMGIASVADNNTLSTFSNYGPGLVFEAAPGEAVITTYPFGTYAAGWGTSFSAPFVTGTVALLMSAHSGVTQGTASQAISQATSGASNLGHGVLDVYSSVAAWRAVWGY